MISSRIAPLPAGRPLAAWERLAPARLPPLPPGEGWGEGNSGSRVRTHFEYKALVVRSLALLMLISLAARCASTTPLNADAKNIRVIEWWSGSPNEVEVNSVMDCPALGRPEKGDDRNALINLGAARGANIVLLKIPKGKSVMAVPTYGADFEATFYRCAQVNGMSHALGIDPRSSPTRTLSDEVKQE